MKFFFSHLQIIMGLKIHPALGVRSKKNGQSQRCIGGNRSFPCNNISDTLLRNSNRLASLYGVIPIGSRKSFKKISPGARGTSFFFSCSHLSVIINDLDIKGKANTPLIVYSDVPSSHSATRKLFKTVCRRNAEKFERSGNVHNKTSCLRAIG